MMVSLVKLQFEIVLTFCMPIIIVGDMALDTLSREFVLSAVTFATISPYVSSLRGC